ncbi:DEAD/DEAH box helicase family protein [Corynebacterium macclintockiae]|uniref:restriction endonuclease n=1 Tax=Corynebacterium macclintockiae TaxID=2913501 RepID=UPI003EBA9A70
MKFKFDAKQEYQVQAIDSVTELFEGQPNDAGDFLTTFRTQRAISEDSRDALSYDLSEEIGAIGNNFLLDEATVLENLKVVQNEQGLEPAKNLSDGLQFDIEMETGTGKTYVYLRTIFELAEKYSFTKFVILVPSVAIREGVKTSIELMHDHFRQLYPASPFDYMVYSGKNAEEVQSFATSTSIQIMIMTIGSVRGRGNNLIMNQTRDKLNGLRPIDFLRATRPILIMDEPQNMESELSKTALAGMDPAFILRYSATHREMRNVAYRLDPVDAHELGLVKQIVVAEATEHGGDAKPYIKLLSIDSNPWQASLELVCRKKDGSLARQVKKVGRNQDLETVSGNPAYGNNWRINEFNLDGSGFIELTNHGILQVGESIGGNDDTVYREMIRETIREHFRKELQMRPLGIKVLSLFFVDRVASYLGDGTDNTTADGKFAQWFDELFIEERARFSKHKELLPQDPIELRRAYFSQIKKGVYGDTSGVTAKDDDSYDLIMKDKARLLSEDEPVRFVFSHSALREGWDNPNVFQICTLREMGSETERRQTIGRGLRLPVNQDGERVADRSVAQLTVVANESYQEFATNLQKEYRKAGVAIGYIRKGDFAKLSKLDSEEQGNLGYTASAEIWEYLKQRGYLDKDGFVTEAFTPDADDFSLRLPAEYCEVEPAVIEVLRRANIKQYVKPKRARTTRKLNKQLYFRSHEFEELWEKISQRTTYSVSVDRDVLIENAVQRIMKAESVEPLRIEVKKARLTVARGGTKGRETSSRMTSLRGGYRLPDIVSELQQATSLTRATIIDILIQSDRLDEFISNPNDYIKMVKEIIKAELAALITEGVQYEKIGGSVYSLTELQRDGLEERQYFLDNLYKVKNQEKTDYDFVVYDSEAERQFAELLDEREDIKLFLKLPPQFKIDTPVGPYNPDWAIVKQEDGEEKLFMIRETKSTMSEHLLRPTEQAKIDAATEHFKTIGVNYAKAAPGKWNL